jgi:histidinol-phosphate aminotransferase
MPLIAGREAALLLPTFSPIEKGVLRVASSIAPLKLEGSMLRGIDSCKDRIVFLVNPNNPTGTLIDRIQMEEIARVSKLLIVDEAYMHFAGQSITELSRNLPLLVIKTISKLGSAVAQLGIVIGKEEILRQLSRHSHPSPVGMLTALSIFSEKGMQEISRIVAMLSSEKERVRNALLDLGYSPMSSSTNFLLLREKHNEAEGLLSLGIRVKRMVLSGKSYMRITIRSRWENDLLLVALEDLHR